MPWRRADLLDEADRARHGGGRILLEPEGQGEEEEDLGVARSADEGIELRIDGQHELALDLGETAICAVVHPEPFAVPEGMAVGVLDRRAGRRPDMGEDHAPT